MGRMKEYMMAMEEEEWLTEEQEKWLNDVFRWKGVVYGDLIDIESICEEKFRKIQINLVDGSNFNFYKEDIEEINGLCIKFQRSLPLTDTIKKTVIPFDKIVRIVFEYEK